jgi:uncharacterized protein YdiU (UPF0061 family)
MHALGVPTTRAISGETIDYGPCAFMEQFHPDCVYSSIDRYGRYAWGNQAQIAQWNLTRFAETLLPLIDADIDAAIEKAEASLVRFAAAFQKDYLDVFRAKLALPRDEERSPDFVKRTLEKLSAQEMDFTGFFRQLTRVAAGEDPAEFVALWQSETEARDWLGDWREIAQPKAGLAAMQAANPVLIPRNHQVERAIQSGYSGDFAHFHRLVEALARPFAERSEYADLEAPARPEERVTETFCGT